MMNKSRKTSNLLTKCSLKQIDIYTAIQNWTFIKKEKDMKKITILPNDEPILIEDSDSEVDTNDLEKEHASKDITFPRRKRQLAQSFSDNEENTEDNFNESRGQDERFPKIKRELSRSFDEVDLDEETMLANEQEETNKTEENVRPMTCSTPLPAASKCSVPETFRNYQHVGIHDISQVNIINFNNSESSRDSDATIIFPHSISNQSSETTLHIQQNIIITPSDGTIYGATTANPSKKRSADYDKNVKKMKTVSTILPQSGSTFLGILNKTETSKGKSLVKRSQNSKDSSLSETSSNTDNKIDTADSNSKKKDTVSQKRSVTKSVSNCQKWLSKNDQPTKAKYANEKRKAGTNKIDAVKKKNICKSDPLQNSLQDKTTSDKKKDTQENVDKKALSAKETMSNQVNLNSTDKSKITSVVTTHGAVDTTREKQNCKNNSGSTNELVSSPNQPNRPSLVIRKSVITTAKSAEDPETNKQPTTSKGLTSATSRDVDRAGNQASKEEQTTTKNKEKEVYTFPKEFNDEKSLNKKKNIGETRSISLNRSSSDEAGSSLDSSFKAKKEEKKINMKLLTLMTDLFKTVFSSKHLNNLLDPEKKTIRMFLDMDHRYQYACLRLITRQKKWYNIFKFCELIYLDMEDTEISDMYTSFEQNGIVDTNYVNDGIVPLLNHLNNTDLRGICDYFRINKKIVRKEDMIKCLLKYCNTQSTLTVNKTTKDLLLEKIQTRMGRCIRISDTFHSAFHATYTLGTFTNSRFMDMNEYSASILRHNVTFPEYPIDDYAIFESRTDFIKFAKARRYLDELEKVSDPPERLQICKTIFSDLKNLENDKNDQVRFKDAPHLMRFTARAVYASALSNSAEKLFCKYPEDVKTWLEYMIKKLDFPHKIGHWYYYLIWLYMRYLKPLNYDQAAHLLMVVLQHKREHLSEVQLYQLRRRGEQLLSTKKYEILRMNKDCIIKLLPKRIKAQNFSEIEVDANTIRSDTIGRKRDYIIRHDNGDRSVLNVEEIALVHYVQKLGYTDGQHCEGALVKAMFILSFFDIIYSAKKVIPGTFVSKIQSEPLDMNSRYFYGNRKEEIEKRLKEIECEWSDDQLKKFLLSNYEKHSHEFAVCEVGVIIEEPGLLVILVDCIGRKVLAKIFERLVRNFREYRSGMPDLLVWNEDKKECKFVEVKGENDKLSVGQTLWLHYLHSIGAKIEVCHVHSIGSKRKKKVVSKSVLEEPSTSSVADKVP